MQKTIMNNCHKEKPVLYLNCGEEDEKAYFAIKTSRIPCNTLPTNGESPIVTYGLKKFVGYKKIEEFIAYWKSNKNKNNNFDIIFLENQRSDGIAINGSLEDIYSKIDPLIVRLYLAGAFSIISVILFIFSSLGLINIRPIVTFFGMPIAFGSWLTIFVNKEIEKLEKKVN